MCVQTNTHTGLETRELYECEPSDSFHDTQSYRMSHLYALNKRPGGHASRHLAGKKNSFCQKSNSEHI